LVEAETELHLFLSPDVEQLLLENEVDVVSLLAKNGVEVRRAAPMLAASAEEGTKEPVTVILAASALVVSLTPLLSKLISSLSRRPVLVEERVPVAVEDSQGNVVRDAHGVPVVEWVDRTRYVEAAQLPEPDASLKIEGPLGLHIGYASGDHALQGE
jgi:hypothetical protein